MTADWQRAAAAAEMDAHRGRLAQHGTLVEGTVADWPRWLLDVIHFHNAAVDVDARGCEHLITPGPRPACTSPKTPGQLWCLDCAGPVLNSLPGLDMACDGCGRETDTRYRFGAINGHIVTWLLVCLECRSTLVGAGS